jgi:nitrite reductase (NADH) small subunit
VKVLSSSELPEGGRRVVHVGALAIAVARVEGRVYAIGNTCPHREGSLGDGDLQGHHLYCPQHAWCFDVRDGNSFFPAGVSVPSYPVREEGGAIYIEIPE